MVAFIISGFSPWQVMFFFFFPFLIMIQCYVFIFNSSIAYMDQIYTVWKTNILKMPQHNKKRNATNLESEKTPFFIREYKLT